jgi:hypothetical protein
MIRNVLLLVAVAFFVVAFFVMPDGCAAYTGEEMACVDPSGLGQTVGQFAHMLFAGLAILSAGLMDYSALERHLFPIDR